MTILQKEFKKKTFASVCNLVGAQICKLKNKLSGDNPNHYPSLTPAEVLWRHYPLDFKCFWLFPPFFFGQEGGGNEEGARKKMRKTWTSTFGFCWLHNDDDDHNQALSGYIQEMWPQGLSQCQEQLCLHSHISKFGRPHTLLLFRGIFKKTSHISKYGRPSISHTLLLLFWGGI